MTLSAGDTVTIEYVGRLEDGSVFDTSRRDVADQTGLVAENPTRRFEPLTIEIGSETVIAGLDEALREMEEGEQTTIVVSPEKAYGPYLEDKIGEYDRGEFEELIGDQELTEGFEVETESGMPGAVIEVTDETVTVDFNHELAGETLTFDIEVIEVEREES